jgi:hypothetical protein
MVRDPDSIKLLLTVAEDLEEQEAISSKLRKPTAKPATAPAQDEVRCFQT